MYQPTLEESLAATIAGNWIQSGDEMRGKAHEWITAHPSEWLDIEELSRELVAKGKPFSLREQVTNPLKYGKWHGVGLANPLTAPMSRILSERIPGFRELCRMNKSKVDA